MDSNKWHDFVLLVSILMSRFVVMGILGAFLCRDQLAIKFLFGRNFLVEIKINMDIDHRYAIFIAGDEVGNWQ